MGTPNDIQTKAWSSGRVLTSVQRARKQKMDRMSKKQLQQRQQDYLKTLENRINDLESTLRKALSQHTRTLPMSRTTLLTRKTFRATVPRRWPYCAIES
jgi:FixJ family two-component response regulator